MKSSVKGKILELIRNHPEGVPQSNIHKALRISKGRTSEVLRELESYGLVHRIKIGNQYMVVPPTKTFKHAGGKALKLGLVWSSEYPFITPFVKLMKKNYGYEVFVKVFPNALAATRSLITGEVDLALTPLITQLFTYALTKSIKVIGGGASGGSSIMLNQHAQEDVVLCSELSTMDLCRTLAIKKCIIDVSEVRYFSNPISEINTYTAKHGSRFVIVWHPITEYLKDRGFKTLMQCSELGIPYCCTLASSSSIEEDLRSKVSQSYKEALELFSKDPHKWVEWYSALVGINADLVSRGIKEYEIKHYLDVKSISKMIADAGIEMPNISSLSEAFV